MFSRGALAHLLRNPIYARKVTHKGAVYDGDGRNMTPTHTFKSGMRYRYYVTHQNAMVGADAPATWRTSAPELEQVVVDRLQHWLRDRRAMVELAVTNAAASAIETAQRQATALADPLVWMVLVAKLISRIEIVHENITISIASAAALTILGVVSDESAQTIELTCHAQRIRQGKDVRMIVADNNARSIDTINIRLVALIAKAHDLHRALVDAPEHTIASLADTLGKCRKRSAKLLCIAHLAPDTVARCIAGTQPASLTTKALLNIDLPISWHEQRALRGIH